jgi:hypothetical protein
VRIAILTLLAVLLLAPLTASAAPGDALTIPAAVQIQPAELAVMLKAGDTPPILQVGFQRYVPAGSYPQFPVCRTGKQR